MLESATNSHYSMTDPPERNEEKGSGLGDHGIRKKIRTA